MYLLDTNTVIYHFKGVGNVSRKLLDASPSQIALSAVTVFEIETGIAKSSRRQPMLEQFLSLTAQVEVLSFGAREARSAAEIRASLEKAGAPIGPFDILIAGTAIAHNAVLVTHNTREFERVPGLRIADWF